MRFKILLLAFIMMAYAAGFLPFARAQELEVIPVQKEAEVTGKIYEINYETREIFFRDYTGMSMDDYRQDTIYVPKEAKIEKDNNLIEFTDLSFGQRITVKYEIGAEGRKEATHIWVESEQPYSR